MTDYMVQCPPSVDQESPSLWNPQFHHCSHKNSLLDTILSQLNPVHIYTTRHRIAQLV